MIVAPAEKLKALSTRLLAVGSVSRTKLFLQHNHLTSSYPIIAQQTINQSNTYQPIFVLDGNTGPPAGAPPVFPTSGHLKPPPDTLLKPRPFNWKTEYVDSWNFTIEQGLAKDVRLAVAYVGNGGRDLDWGWTAFAGPVDRHRGL